MADSEYQWEHVVHVNRDFAKGPHGYNRIPKKDEKMIAKSIIAGSGPNASQPFSPATQSNPSLFEGGTINKMKGEETKKSSSLTSFKLKQRPSTGDEPEIK